MDRNFELSSYQKDIINFVRTQRGNLLVDAKAGSGKTSTLIMIADELTATGNKCLFLAFNKHIVEELQQKITNTNCMIKTVHSLGFTFIKSFLYRKHNTHYVLEVDTSKLRNLVKDYYDNNFRNRLDIYNATGVCDVEGYDSDELDELSDGAMKLDDKELKDLHNNIISDFVGLCNFSRLYNINYKAMGSLDGLVEKFCWHLDRFKREIFPDYQDLIIAVIDKTKELFENPDLAPNGDPVYVVDYTDMLYFPVLYNMQIPYSIKDYLNTVMVDECIPDDMYIETADRKMLFREVKHKVDKGERVLVKSFNENTETFEYKPVISVVDKGFKDVYEITTNGLNKIQATANHPFLTQNGWKRLDELNVGVDYLYLDKPDNQKTKYILNDDQLQIAYASILGDGSIDTNGFKYEYRLKFTQGDKQYNYFKFKKNMFNCVKERKGESGYTNKMSINNTSTKMFLLPVKTKLECIKQLDLRGLAILYMDDGSTGNNLRGWGTRIHCNNFSDEETEALINKLSEYGIMSKNFPVGSGDKVYNEIHINTDNSLVFFKKIAPYMHTDCFYKNPYSTGDYVWDNKFKQFGGNIVKSVCKIGVKRVLDMEVADNHNFCVSKYHQKNGASIVVHNCQDLSILQQKFIQKLQSNFNRFIFVRRQISVNIFVRRC